MKNLIDSLTVFGIMLINGVIGPFREDSEQTAHSLDTDQ